MTEQKKTNIFNIICGSIVAICIAIVGLIFTFGKKTQLIESDSTKLAKMEDKVQQHEKDITEIKTEFKTEVKNIKESINSIETGQREILRAVQRNNH